jgi:hypothetical protein
LTEQEFKDFFVKFDYVDHVSIVVGDDTQEHVPQDDISVPFFAGGLLLDSKAFYSSI